MLKSGDVLDLSPLGGIFIIRKTGADTSGQSFEMEWELLPNSGGTPVHTHPHAIETYEVLEGELDIFVDGEWQTLIPGDKAVAEKGVPHTFRNSYHGTTRVYETHQPALNYSEYFEKMYELVRSGIVHSPKLSFKAFLHLCILMTSYPEEIQPSNPPAPVMRFFAALGRLLGYGDFFAPKIAVQT